jgi:hypothetical protein
LIKPTAETFGLKVLRANDIYSPGVITEQIKAAIHQSRICIADITGKNPNVLYEVGIAHTLGKPTILLSQRIEEIPFNLRALRVVIYDTGKIRRARENLVSTIQQILGKGRLAEAERLLQQGNARTAIFATSIYFEHALRELVYRNEARIADLLHRPRPELLTMGQMLEYLSKLSVISKNDLPKIRKCVDLRNRTVHELAEPKISDAKLFIKVASDFVEKYLGEDFQ